MTESKQSARSASLWRFRLGAATLAVSMTGSPVYAQAVPAEPAEPAEAEEEAEDTVVRATRSGRRVEDEPIRVEPSIVLDPEKAHDLPVLAAQIQSDTLTFLRTVDLAQVEGSRGLLHLREDLRERAQLRSPAVSDYLIQALIAQ